MTREQAMIESRKAGRILARNSRTRAYANAVARTLSVDEGNALLAGYYAERAKENATMTKLNNVRSYYFHEAVAKLDKRDSMGNLMGNGSDLRALARRRALRHV